MPFRRSGALVAPLLIAAAMGLTVPAAAHAVTAATNLKATSTTASSISLSWTASPDAVGYYVWRGDAGWANWRMVKQLPSRTTTSYTDAALQASTTYTYAVRAYDAAGNKPSNAIMETTKASGTTPTPAPTSPMPAPASPTPSGSVFSTSSVWNTPIPASPVLDAKSSTWASFLAGGAHPALLYDFGVPIYEPPAGTSRYAVRSTMSPSWGPDPFAGHTVPLRSTYTPSAGSDGAMVVIDWSNRTSYEFWQYSWNGGRPQHSWGGPVSLDGQGTGFAVGAGLSRLAGVVRAREIEAGVINHPLVFGSDRNCRGVFRHPATKTDGWSTDANCIPEGARVQLDPSIDVSALPGLTRAERIVARALQVYGAFLVDNAGARMAFPFETPTDEADPYRAAGLAWDYFELGSIPWHRLRVLRQADGR